MLLPFWLALSASMVLHIGVLLAPGWALPLDAEPEATTLDATLAMPAPTVRPGPATPPPAVKKRLARPHPPALPPTPPTPVAPQAEMPADPVVAEPVTTEPAIPEPEPVVPPVPPVAPVAAPDIPVATPPAVLPAPTFVNHWPRSGRIVYQVSYGEKGFIIGQSEQRWAHDGSHYRLHAETETTGLAALIRPGKVVQDSRGYFDDAGFRPLEYETQLEGKSKDSVLFDPEQGKIVLGRGGSASFVPAAQDLLSIFYQLAILSFDVPTYPLTIATGRKVATYSITVGAESLLDTPQGPRRVRHLKITGNAKEDATEIWLDVESRLPLKIRHRDRKGEIFDQVATLIEVESPQ